MKKDLKFIKSIYDTKSFADKADFAKKTFKDAGGIILARNLEHVSSEIFTQEFAGLTFLQGGITVNNEGGYANSITKLKLKAEGGFRESGSNTQTTGKITLSGESDNIPVFTLEGESDWSEVELKQAELENINLPSRYFEAHAELYNRKIDELGYLGQTRTDGTQKTLGLLNYGFVASGAGDTAANLSGDNLYQAIADLITDQWAGVFNVETYKADRVVMPDTVYNICAKKILNSNGSEMSVLRALMTNFPTVTFGLTTKARDVDGSSRTTAYSSNRRAMQMRIPTPLNVSSVDQRGFKYYVESYFGVAGLDVIEDTAGRHLTGL
ncbi:major capsid protein [Vibrio phage 1.154.O._10N.222.52.B12]|nr:major capsid protein [Vibrio phage 1.154.O._10N.222.52.B12]